jgi:bacterioferritin B
MPDSRFAQSLNQQVGHEFAASQQYIAIAVHYDDDALPLLAAYFYAQALEERNHAMMMVQYLLDADLPVAIPGIEAPITSFTSLDAPIALALEQEKRVSEQIAGLVGLARETSDFQSEQFLQWFLKEQVEEVASMTTLLRVVERAGDNALLVEDYLARTPREDAADPTAPSAAGGAL